MERYAGELSQIIRLILHYSTLCYTSTKDTQHLKVYLLSRLPLASRVGVSQFPFFNICLSQVLGIKEVLTREDGTATWGVDIKVGFAKPSMLEA